MTRISRLTFLLPLACALSPAAQWSGALVDSACYASAESNVSPGHPGSTNSKRPIRTCSPNDKTKAFSVVPPHGATLNLDSDGNDKARQLILKEGKKSPYMVNVTGELNEDTLKVDTISIAK
jgi:hypothetical protein